MADQPIKLEAENGQGDTFENIFSQTKKTEKDSKMVKSILVQKASLEKLRPILGDTPDLGKTLEEEREFRLKKKMRTLQSALAVLVLLGFGMVFFFYSQLSPSFSLFGANLIQRLADTNSSLNKLQTQINKSRYLAAQLALNELSYQTDRFFGNFIRSRDQTISIAEKNIFTANFEDAKSIMPGLISDIRANLTSDFFVKTTAVEKQPSDDELLLQAQNELRTVLNDERKTLGQNSNNPEDLQNAKLTDQTLQLIGNRNLISTLQSTSVDEFSKRLEDYVQNYDEEKDKQLRRILDGILSSSKSQLAVIAEIKRNRVEWSRVIQQIENVTTQTDPVFGKPLLSQDNSIVYSGYEFDAATQKIVLSGMARTRDGKNFTLMSDLMARLDQSPFFNNIEMRSFSKTKDINEGGNQSYIANFKIDLQLESGDASAQDQKVSLTAPQPAGTGIKR